MSGHLPVPPATAEASGQPQHWAHVTESTFVWGMLALYTVYRFLGRWPFRLCLYPVVSYYWLTRRHARRASLEFLQRHHAHHRLPGPVPRAIDSFRHFLSFAEVMLDKMLAYTGRYRVQDLVVSGHEPLLEQLAAGQGAVLVTSHTGCVELCQAMAERRQDLKLTILVHTHHAPRYNSLIKRLTGASTVQFLQVTDFSVGTAMMLSERVQRGELIAIAGDRIPVGGGRMCRTRFLGHEANFPIGPYIMAGILKCPLYFMGCIRHNRGYTIRFKELAARILMPKKERDQALSHYARLYAQELEELLKPSPHDWFNFFDFWQQGPAISDIQQH